MKYLLGRLKDGDFAFADIRVEKRNGKEREFAACFETVRPFNTSEIDVEEYLDELFGPDDYTCYDREQKYDLCVKYHCSPYDLPRELAAVWSIEDVIDCSLYVNEVRINGDDWRFESGSFGQLDLKIEDFDKLVSEGGFLRIKELWEKYHLSDLPEDRMKDIEFIDEVMLPAYSNYAEWFIEDCLKEENDG